MWTLLQPDYAHSGGDRTAGDDDALASAANELRYLGGETRKLFCVERVGARPSENAGAELEENAPGFSGHAELLSKSENERAQEYLVRRYEHNYFRGWVVGTQRQGKQYQRYFSDKPHGPRESLRTAGVFRDKLLARLPPPTKIKRTDIRNTTEVIAVASVKERTRSGTLIVRYVASWPTRSGKRGNASFSVGLYGQKQAFTLAVSARRAGLRDFKIR